MNTVFDSGMAAAGFSVGTWQIEIWSGMAGPLPSPLLGP
jgi:hypothetical protein